MNKIRLIPRGLGYPALVLLTDADLPARLAHGHTGDGHESVLIHVAVAAELRLSSINGMLQFFSLYI